MRNGKLVLLLTVLATIWPGAGILGAHEVLKQNQGAEAQSAGTRISPAPPFAETYGQPGARAALEAANALLAEMSAEQADAIVLPIDSPLRGNWSNLPSGVTRFERNGLRLGDLTSVQLERAFNFLAAALGPHGYETATRIVGADAILKAFPRAARAGWSDDNYWLAFFGQPTGAGRWGWQFGGHHLAINGSFADGRATGLSPTFVGVEPAEFQYAGALATLFADELAAGHAVMQALPEPLRREASITPRPRSVEAGAGQDGFIPEVLGSAVAGWPEKARALLLETIGHWVLLQPRENADARMAALEAGLDDLHFAWNGPHEAGDGGHVYYRIQGPTLIIEFSVEDGIAVDGPHFHTIYRDPTNEYGAGTTP
ncbi:MAG: DUF3500 domain-containing protein [Gammaproteobacteria bacterium]|nr:DUF3500 domain-containing protein [Gammaproteobacteria bacterium]MYE48156.1 DUF3500 domain-containing protein [Gammaproteobacteria bacterium]MYF67617.1 DUF3500 domain-containing protein [Gammaproteobacteria bacterium]MYK36180.1 DUF3500 domain-containing protein [Gammaproteobacteria bacterium]